jgi:hypothetical protein
VLDNGLAYNCHFWTLLLPNDVVYSVILDVYVCTYGIINIWTWTRAGGSDDSRCCPMLYPLHPVSKQVDYPWNL